MVLGALPAIMSEGHLFITNYNLRELLFLKDIALYNSLFCLLYLFFVTVNLLVTLLFWY